MVANEVSNITDDAAGIPDGQCSRRNIPVHHASCADDAVVADSDARKDADVRSYPHVVAYGDRAGIFESLVALGHIEWMPGRIDAYVGGDEDVVAYGHFRSVEDCQIDVGECVAPDEYIVSVVAMERAEDYTALTDLSQHFLQDL